MKYVKENLPLIAVITAAILMLLPFLGLTEFNTKGEPREAVVALSMLKDGDWILPVNNGVDIPYKPPFFHYCIAVVSLIFGGVNEYTSRLPSALALIALAVGCFAFYRRRLSASVALVGSLLLLTSFEVHRAGVNCRVDMVLTVFTVGAMLLFYRWWERGSHGVPVWAVLCMSCAVLTKGPVGFIVPCFVMGVFTLLRGGGFWRTFLAYAGFALLSCILPAVWYVAAWHEGSDKFLNLVYEENIGRMTGTMSYESHTHAFPYNFFTLFTGWVPWTLLLVMSLFAKPWKGIANASKGLWGSLSPTATTDDDAQENVKENNNKTKGNNNKDVAGEGFSEEKKVGKGKCLVEIARRLRIRIMTIPPVKLFTWLGFLLVLFFYCLPSSKRSVYLLPCYPFMAVIIAEYIEWLWQTRRRGVLRAYTIIIVALSLLLTAAFVAVRLGAVPDTMFHGKHAADNIAILHALRDTPMNLWTLILVCLPVMCAVFAVRDMMTKRTREWRGTMYYNLLMPVIVLFIALDGFYQPLVLNTKSLRPMAEYIARTFPGEPVYQYVNDRMMHFFGADFYLNDTIAQFETPVNAMYKNKMKREIHTPQRGVLVVPEGDFEGLAKRHPDYTFTLVHTSTRNVAEMKQHISFYRFEIKDNKAE